MLSHALPTILRFARPSAKTVWSMIDGVGGGIISTTCGAAGSCHGAAGRKGSFFFNLEYAPVAVRGTSTGRRRGATGRGVHR